MVSTFTAAYNLEAMKDTGSFKKCLEFMTGQTVVGRSINILLSGLRHLEPSKP